MAELAAILARRRKVNIDKGETVTSGQGDVKGISVESSPSRIKERVLVEDALFEVGAKIEARYGGGEAYFPGMVSEVNSDGTLFIAYDDGDEELSVPIDFVRPYIDSDEDVHDEADDGCDVSGEEFSEDNECMDYRINTSAASFGICMCGKPKNQHTEAALSKKPKGFSPSPKKSPVKRAKAISKNQAKQTDADGEKKSPDFISSRESMNKKTEEINTVSDEEAIAHIIQSILCTFPTVTEMKSETMAQGMGALMKHKAGNFRPVVLPSVGDSVWYSDVDEVWAEGRVVGVYDQEFEDLVRVEVRGSGGKVMSFDWLQKDGEQGCRDLLVGVNRRPTPDLCSLNHLHEAAILDNLHSRWKGEGGSREAYTFLSVILAAVNPLKKQPNPPVPKDYIDQSFASTESRPHPYALAELAFKQMVKPMNGAKLDQSIVISGESGSGKTESAKIVLGYLCSRTQSASVSRGPELTPEKQRHEEVSLDRRVLASNPIFEAFGNAKTTRNSNSSRFGKFIKLLFDAQGSDVVLQHALVGAECETYLLEKSRVVAQADHERNFHSFFQLLALGSDRTTRTLLGIELDSRSMPCPASPSEWVLLGGSADSDKVIATGVDDTVEATATIKAFGELSALKSEHSQRAVWRALSACLHLGQLQHDEESALLQSDEVVENEVIEPVEGPPSTSLETPDQRAEEWLDELSYLNEEDSGSKLKRVIKMAVTDLRMSQEEASKSAADDMEALVGKLRRHCLSFLGQNEIRRRVLDLCSISFADSKTMSKEDLIESFARYLDAGSLVRKHPKELKKIASGLPGGTPSDASTIVKALQRFMIDTGKLPTPMEVSAAPSPRRRGRNQGSTTSPPQEEESVIKKWAMSLEEHGLDLSDIKSHRVIHAAWCLGCKPHTLLKLLTERRMSRKLAGGLVEEFFIPLEGDEKTYARDAIIKAIYQSLFQWVVNTINSALAPDDQSVKTSFIGVLDIFGFETFEVNTFETLLINHANEVLQHTFNHHVFEAEVHLFESEGVLAASGCDVSSFPNNRLCVDLVTGNRGGSSPKARHLGIVRTLDDVSRQPKCTDEAFIAALSKVYSPDADTTMVGTTVSNPHWIPLPPHKRRWNFCVRHFAADVTYTVTEDNLWVQRNNDAVPSGLAQMLQEANHAVVYFSESENESSEDILKRNERTQEDCCLADEVVRGIGRALKDITAEVSPSNNSQSKKGKPGSSGQLVKSTVSSMFISSIERLTARLDATSCSFIRCIKPSMALSDGFFDRPYVAAQLRYLGILQTCEVLRAGLPCRVPYSVMAPFFQKLSASSRLLFAESSHEVTSGRRALAQKISPKANHAHVNHPALDEQLAVEDAPLSLFTACALKCASISSESCALGRTKLFFKAGEMGAVDKLLARAALLSQVSTNEEEGDIGESSLKVPELSSGTIGDGGLNEDDLLKALQARKKAETMLFAVSDLWCGVTAALRRVSNDEVRLYEAMQTLSKVTAVMVEAHAQSSANDRFKKMKSRAEKLSNLMNSSLGDMDEDFDESDSEFVSVAKSVLADAEVVRHAAHKAKSHRDKVSRAVSTVAQQLRECEKLRNDLSHAARWVTNALLVARYQPLNRKTSSQSASKSKRSAQTEECTDSLEELKFMDDVLLPTQDQGDSVCSLFASGLRHARHCNSEEACDAARECMTILQDILLGIRRHIDETDAVVPRLEDLTHQTEAFTKLVLKLSMDAKTSLERAENYYASSKDMLLAAQIRALVKDALGLMAKTHMASGVHHIDKWSPLPLLAIAILNGNSQVAETLLSMPPHQLREMVLAAGHGTPGASLLHWLKHHHHARGCHETEWKQLLQRLALVAANPNAPVDAEGRSALMLLAWHGAGGTKSSEVAEKERHLAQLLLDNGASPFDVDDEGNDAVTLAAATGRIGLLKTLMEFVQEHEDPNKVADIMCSSLVAAAAGGAYDTATYLVSEGVSVNSVDQEGGCSIITIAVMAACTSEPPSDKIPTTAANTLFMGHDASPLKHVTRNNYQSPFSHLQGSLVEDDETARLRQVLAEDMKHANRSDKQVVVKKDSYSLVQWLLNQGADVGILDDDGYSPFAVACLRGNIIIAEHILNHVPISFARRRSPKYGAKSPISRSFSNSSSGSFSMRETIPIISSPKSPQPQSKPNRESEKTESTPAPVFKQPTLIRRNSRKKTETPKVNISTPEVPPESPLPEPTATPATPEVSPESPLPEPTATPATPEVPPESPLPEPTATPATTEVPHESPLPEATATPATPGVPPESPLPELPVHVNNQMPVPPAALTIPDTGMDQEEGDEDEVDDVLESTTKSDTGCATAADEEEKENRGKDKKVNAKKLLNAFGGSNKSKGKSLLAKAKGKKSKKINKKSPSNASVEVDPKVLQQEETTALMTAQKVLVNEVTSLIASRGQVSEVVGKVDISESDIDVLLPRKTETTEKKDVSICDNKQDAVDEVDKQDDIQEVDQQDDIDEVDKQDDIQEVDQQDAADEVDKQDDIQEVDQQDAADEVDKQDDIQEVDQQDAAVEVDKQDDIQVDQQDAADEVDQQDHIDEVDKQDDIEQVDSIDRHDSETEEGDYLISIDQSVNDHELEVGAGIGEESIYIGMKVIKSFGDFGLYEAVIESFDTATGWWRLHYEDDEEEDLTSDEVLPLRRHWVQLQQQTSPSMNDLAQDEAELALAEALANVDVVDEKDDNVNCDDDDDSIIEDSVIDEDEEMMVEEMGDEWSEGTDFDSTTSHTKPAKQKTFFSASYIDEATEAMEMVMAAMNRTSFTETRARNLSPIIENKSAQSQIFDTKSPTNSYHTNQLIAEQFSEEASDSEYEEEYEGNEEVVLLRALHNYVNLRATSDGMTALHLAASENHGPCVEWLLSLGADVAQRNEAGETALFTASKLGHVQVVRLLSLRDPEGVLEGGPKGASSILAACLGGHIRCVEALEKAISGLGEGLAALKRLKELDDVLLEVCKMGHIDIVEYLLRAGADINTCDEYGETPIMIASHFGHKDLVQYLLHRSCDFVSGRSQRQRGGIGKSNSGTWD